MANPAFFITASWTEVCLDNSNNNWQPKMKLEMFLRATAYRVGQAKM